MPYSQELANRIREALTAVPKVEEKRMFSGIAFMVDGKMCINAGDNRIMCRIDPDLHAKLIKKSGCSTVQMKGHDYKGFIWVTAEALKSQKDFNEWIALALDFNKKAKATLKKNKKV